MSYCSVIFYHDDAQKHMVEQTIADVDASGLWPGKAVTEIASARPCWETEPEHQDYLERNPNGNPATSTGQGLKLPVRQGSA